MNCAGNGRGIDLVGVELEGLFLFLLVGKKGGRVRHGLGSTELKRGGCDGGSVGEMTVGSRGGDWSLQRRQCKCKKQRLEEEDDDDIMHDDQDQKQPLITGGEHPLTQPNAALTYLVLA